MCPNIGECWSHGTATLMLMGDVCTRACKFCAVDTGNPRGRLDENEPAACADSVKIMDLKYVVLTSVDRDDLPDGGADQFVKVIERLRVRAPGTTVEILTPDFRNKPGALEKVIAAKPDVFNPNLETVPRLYPTIRPGARYFHSLRLLEKVKEGDPAIFTKSGLMVGLGEEEREVHQVMDDMRSANIDFLTIGQYLRPTIRHIPVARYVPPEEFADYRETAQRKGFLMVSASPMTRSSYHAGADFAGLRDAGARRSLA